MNKNPYVMLVLYGVLEGSQLGYGGADQEDCMAGDGTVEVAAAV